MLEAIHKDNFPPEYPNRDYNISAQSGNLTNHTNNPLFDKLIDQ